MGNKAGKNKVTAEDMEFLMSQVEDKSLGTESAFYRLNFTDSGHTKARMKVIATAGQYKKIGITGATYTTLIFAVPTWATYTNAPNANSTNPANLTTPSPGLEIVVDPGNPIPRNKMRVAETFGLNSRYLVVNSDICWESYYSVMDHLGFCRTISSILSGNCLKFVM